VDSRFSLQVDLHLYPDRLASRGSYLFCARNSAMSRGTSSPRRPRAGALRISPVTLGLARLAPRVSRWGTESGHVLALTAQGFGLAFVFYARLGRAQCPIFLRIVLIAGRYRVCSLAEFGRRSTFHESPLARCHWPFQDGMICTDLMCIEVVSRVVQRVGFEADCKRRLKDLMRHGQQPKYT